MTYSNPQEMMVTVMMVIMKSLRQMNVVSNKITAWFKVKGDGLHNYTYNNDKGRSYET